MLPSNGVENLFSSLSINFLFQSYVSKVLIENIDSKFFYRYNKGFSLRYDRYDFIYVT